MHSSISITSDADHNYMDGFTNWPLTTYDVDLTTFYSYPQPLHRPWVRVNFVSSVDGAVEINGLTAGLGSPPDKRVFDVLRELADVVLVGAGTVRAERYGGVVLSTEAQDRRARRGQAPIPPLAVVSSSARLDPAGPLFVDTVVPPLILTTSDAPQDRRERLIRAGADVAIVGSSTADVGQVLHQLGSRKLLRVLCEGGPHLLGTLAAAEAVDELCLTITPCLAGPGAARIIAGSMLPEPAALKLQTMLVENDVLMLRYRTIYGAYC
jgi:riboflavin biosynthesis pyrimidine reductase